MSRRPERNRGQEQPYERRFDRRADMGGSEWSGASGRGGCAHEGPPVDRVYGRRVDMGGSEWSGASGRGGMAYRESSPPPPLNQRSNEGSGRGAQRFDRDTRGDAHFDAHHQGRYEDRGGPNDPEPTPWAEPYDAPEEHDFRGRGFAGSDFGGVGSDGASPRRHEGRPEVHETWGHSERAYPMYPRAYGRDMSPRADGREMSPRAHGRDFQGRPPSPREEPFGGYGVADEAQARPVRGPHWGKGPKGYVRSSERVREEVCDAIANQGEIDATDVEVFVEGSVVTLRGTVVERHHKRALELLVEHVRGVDDVHNELRLARAVVRPERPSDAVAPSHSEASPSIPAEPLAPRATLTSSYVDDGPRSRN